MGLIEEKISGMRFVIAVAGDAAREEIRTAVERLRVTVLVLDQAALLDARAVVDEFVPEVLICDSRTAASCADLTGSTAPIVVVVADAAAKNSAQLTWPAESSAIDVFLSGLVGNVYARKAAELSQLVDHFLRYQGDTPSRPSAISVEVEGTKRNIELLDVLWIEAEGNYAKVHTEQRCFERRETLSNIAERLQLSGFVRIHRSHIINTRAVKDVSEDHSFVLLRDGTRLPIGSQFRNSLELPTVA